MKIPQAHVFYKTFDPTKIFVQPKIKYFRKKNKKPLKKTLALTKQNVLLIKCFKISPF